MNELNDPLSWLQEWFASQCNGSWQYSHGISIDTLDNPGWRIGIDLGNTILEGKSFETVCIDRTPTDWVRCWVESSRFQIACGPRNLTEVIKMFRAFAES